MLTGEMGAKIEKVARALCEHRVRTNMKRWNEHRDEDFIKRAVDYAWGDFTDKAIVAINALEDDCINTSLEK